MKKNYFLLLLLLIATGAFGQNAFNTRVEYETECLGVEEDGSQTVRAWGLGRGKTDALDQAKKNAVRDVIFKGISKGAKGCNMRPLVTDVNVREEYEDYFNRFFRDGGPYEQYVSKKDEKLISRDKAKDRMGMRIGVTLRVLRSELKARLKRDGIIK